MTNTTEDSSTVDMVALQRTLDEIGHVIGNDRISVTSPEGPAAAERNVSLFRSRDVHAVIRPRTTADVQTIVRIFNRYRTNAGLHAISTGRNWGLGSAQPANDGVVTIDLGTMKAIRATDLGSGWAAIEPGVTQHELARSLAGTNRIINITASSGHTSVVGNALERGVGLRHQRTEDLVGLEVVLPDGTLAHIGWWPVTSPTTAINPFGHGPALLHLFTQSNLGIVTGAVVRLLPRPESQRVLRLTFSREVLRDAINTLRRWVAQDLTSGVVKIYDSISTTSYGGLPGQHLVLLCVSGTARRVDAISQVIAEEAQACGLFTDMTQSNEVPAHENDFVLQVVEHAYAGDPSRNEQMLRSATGADADHVDSHGGGWMFFLAFVPFNGEAISHALMLVEQIHRETGICPGTTINALSSDVIDLVVSFKFPPTTEATARAHHALDLTYEIFIAAGFHPYRLDIDHTHWRRRLTSEPAYQLGRQIKRLLDPLSVIAPGRYA